jgi:hypothetical protein
LSGWNAAVEPVEDCSEKSGDQPESFFAKLSGRRDLLRFLATPQPSLWRMRQIIGTCGSTSAS